MLVRDTENIVATFAVIQSVTAPYKKIGFVTAYFALSWIPLFLGLHPGMEAQSVLNIASIRITVEFIFILILQLSQHSLLSFIPPSEK